MLAVVLFNIALLTALRRARSRVDVSLLAPRREARCCETTAGECH